MKQYQIAKKFEKRIAEDVGGRRIFLSGAGDEKSDVRVKRSFTRRDGYIEADPGLHLRIEAKTTSRDSYTFRAADWAEVVQAAAKAGEEPIFAVSFSGKHQEYVILRVGLAEALGLPCGGPGQAVERSWSMNAAKLLLDQQRRRICIGGDELVLVVYTTFIAAMRSHGAG